MLPIELQIRTKEQLIKCLELEKSFYSCGFIARLFHLSERAILRRHQILLRKTEFHMNTNHIVRSNWYRVLLIRIQNKYALHIPTNCCEEGLHIMHLGPILINNNAQLGKYCSLHINTAIVASGTSGDAPVLGKYVVLGVGAVVLGGIRIADYTAVAGVPARKISNNGRLEWNKAMNTNGRSVREDINE